MFLDNGCACSRSTNVNDYLRHYWISPGLKVSNIIINSIGNAWSSLNLVCFGCVVLLIVAALLSQSRRGIVMSHAYK